MSVSAKLGFFIKFEGFLVREGSRLENLLMGFRLECLSTFRVQKKRGAAHVQ